MKRTIDGLAVPLDYIENREDAMEFFLAHLILMLAEVDLSKGKKKMFNSNQVTRLTELAEKWLEFERER